MDIVTWQNGSYMAKAATTGSAPTNTSKWVKLMQGSSDYAVAAENTGIKWIDGRPVYRRILTGTSLTDAGSTAVGNIGPVDVIIRLDGFVRRPTGGLHLLWQCPVDGDGQRHQGRRRGGLQVCACPAHQPNFYEFFYITRGASGG